MSKKNRPNQGNQNNNQVANQTSSTEISKISNTTTNQTEDQTMSSEDQTNDGTTGEQITSTDETTTNNVDLSEGINVSDQDTVVGGLNEDTTTQDTVVGSTGTDTTVVTETATIEVPAVAAAPVVVNAAPVVTETPAAPAVAEPSLTTQFTATSAVVAVEAPTVETKGPVALTEFEAFLEKIRTEGTVSQKNLVISFETYMTQLAPGKVIDPNVGARAQYTFWKVLFNVIENSPQEEFKRQWNIVLAFFNNHSKETNQIFHPRKVFRFFEFWINGDDELNAYQRVLNLIQLTADPSEREAGLKRVDVSRALETKFTEVGRARLLGFYQK
jgi:hypothetical protein